MRKENKKGEMEGKRIEERREKGEKEMIELKAPTEERIKHGISVESAILKRKSRRRFDATRGLTEDMMHHLIWAASSIPSAGALYPLEFYAVVGENAVEGFDAAVYHLRGRKLEVHKPGDFRKQLAVASLHQMFIADAPVSIVIAAEYERTTRRYGERGMRYVLMEAGHAGQNIYLECESLGLATVAIGAFHDEEVANVLSLPEKHRPLYIFPIGFSE